MIGKTRKQLRDAQEQLSEIAQLPHVGLARQIQAEIDDATHGVGLDEIVTMAIDRAKGAAVLKALEARLTASDPMEIVTIYAERFGDEKIKQFLADRALAEYEHQQSTALLREMYKEAEVSRRVDLNKLPAGSVITVGLFGTDDDDDEKCYDCEEDTWRIIKARVDHPDQPNLLTIIDDRSEGWRDENLFDDHALVEFGSVRRHGDGNKEFVPELTWGTTPAFRRSGKNKVSVYPYDVGYVLVNDEPILDYKEE